MGGSVGQVYIKAEEKGREKENRWNKTNHGPTGCEVLSSKNESNLL